MKLSLDQIKSITFGAVRVEEEADGIHFYRFTKEQEELYRTMREKSLLVKTFATSGICFRFRTDSAILSFCGQTTPGSTRSYFSFELFVDGEKIGGVDNFVPESYPKGKPNVPFPLGEFSAEFELGEGEKVVELYFPWSVSAALRDVILSDGATVTPLPREKKFLIFGDSITQGYDALYPTNKPMTRLAAHLGAEEINKAIGKEIYFPELADTKENFVPDLIFVTYGSNDWNFSTKEEFDLHCQTFYDNLKKNYPDVPTFMITPVWRKDQVESRPLGPIESVTEFLKKIAEEDKNRHLIFGIDLVEPKEELFADLRLHPNDEGFSFYYENLLSQFEAYGVF